MCALVMPPLFFTHDAICNPENGWNVALANGVL